MSKSLNHNVMLYYVMAYRECSYIIGASNQGYNHIMIL